MSKELENKIVGTDLCKLATLLYDYNICENTSPLNNAGQSCIGTATDKLWRYTLDKLVFNNIVETTFLVRNLELPQSLLYPNMNKVN